MDPRREGLLPGFQKIIGGHDEQQNMEDGHQIKQEAGATRIKEEEEDFYIKEEQKEVDNFIFSPVKTEDDAENLQSFQLHHGQTEGVRGEDCGGPNPHLHPDNKTSDSSETDISDGDEPNSNGGKKFICGECDKRFGRKCHLKRHMLTHTGEKPYSCPMCGKSFSLNANLKTHMRIHTGEKPYSCPMCSKSFSLNANLKVHMEIHISEKYCCSFCHQRFMYKSSMREHQRACLLKKWDDEKQSSCSECGKRFAQKASLKQHMRIHTGEEPYRCPKCFISFKQKGNLKTHMRIHTGEKPYSCSFCQRKFNRKHHLKIHRCVRPRRGRRPNQPDTEIQIQEQRDENLIKIETTVELSDLW
ncbi:uncharacterized protein KZ484_006931 [Pholidichthys leucotaenia]